MSAPVKLLAAIFLLALIYTIQGAHAARKPKTDPAAGQNCTNYVATIDRCASLASYSYTTAYNQYPLNKADFQASCTRVADGLKCLKTYAKCLSSVSRRSLQAFSTARTRHSRKLCSNPSDVKTAEFWTSAQCVRDKNKTKVMVASEQRLIQVLQLLAVNTSMKWDDRFQQACCSADKYRDIVLVDMGPECERYKPATEDMLNSMVGELLETACPEKPRLAAICPKLSKLNIATEGWKAASLTGAALDLIISLADDKENTKEAKNSA